MLAHWLWNSPVTWASAYEFTEHLTDTCAEEECRVLLREVKLKTNFSFLDPKKKITNQFEKPEVLKRQTYRIQNKYYMTDGWLNMIVNV